MGKIIIELEEDINMKIKAKTLKEAIKKIQEKRNLNVIKKFKGIADKNYDMEKNKEEWYKQWKFF